MAEPLKAIYSEHFFTCYLLDVEKVIPTIDKSKFQALVFSNDWENKELKQRMSHIAFVLNQFLSDKYEIAIQQIIDIIQIHSTSKSNGFNFECMFYSEYVSQFGLNNFETSMYAIENITQFTSCEFTVRYFLNSYPDKMVNQMQIWANHPHHYVRRLASEGMRTRLPWAIKVPYLFKNHKVILPILESLVNDDSDWVRLSVSNNLNDLSKDFPEFVHEFSKKWLNHSLAVNKVLKHANRTLLKKGDVTSLALFGIFHSSDIEITDFNLLVNKLKIGESLTFEFELKNSGDAVIPLRIEYFIYFLRNKLKHYPKVYKISEKKLAGNTSITMQKQHSFKEISTRKFYKGEHFVSIVVNGKESECLSFELV